MKKDDSNGNESSGVTTVLHRTTSSRHRKQSQLALLFVIAVLPAMFFFGILSNNATTRQIERSGLFQFLTSPTLLVVQLAYLLAVISLFKSVLSTTRWHRLHLIGVMIAIAVIVYSLSLVLLRQSSASGQFGFAAVGLVAVFGTFPSAAILFVVAPCVLLYAIIRA
jgi:hypothetical protein